ncbi:hypothetical protein [Mycobacterium sp.]
MSHGNTINLPFGGDGEDKSAVVALVETPVPGSAMVAASASAAMVAA